MPGRPLSILGVVGAVARHGVRERAGPMARGRVRDHARFFVHYQQMVVLEEEVGGRSSAMHVVSSTKVDAGSSTTMASIL